MTDKQFQDLLNRLHKAHIKYKKLLRKAHEEYNSRFGAYPGEVDDDFWIDSFEQSTIGATVEEIIEHATHCQKK